MWTKEVLGTDVYHLAAAFVIYSILGWVVESIYMSFCNRKLTNRGFAKGPFCPIYGFGAVIGYLILSPLRDHIFVLYLASSLLATGFEFLAGKLMIGLLGDLWWDYSEKPFNYKGILCLESSLAWGVYGLIVVCFLHGKIMNFIDCIRPGMGIFLIVGILLIAVVDYVIQLRNVFHVNLRG